MLCSRSQAEEKAEDCKMGGLLQRPLYQISLLWNEDGKKVSNKIKTKTEIGIEQNKQKEKTLRKGT